MASPKCPRCPHERRAHSKEGCTEAEFKNGKWVDCPCRVKNMDMSQNR